HTKLHVSGLLSILANSSVEIPKASTEPVTLTEIPGASTLKKEILSEEAAEQISMVGAFLQKQIAQVLRMQPENLNTSDALDELGLDSLMAIELKVKVEKELAINLPVVNLLQGPTIEELSAQVLEFLATPSDKLALPLTITTEELGEFPLSHGQQSMWFAQQLVPEGVSFNPAGAVRVSGALDLEALQTALGNLIRKHAMLRTTFHLKEGEPFQRVHAEIEVPFSVVGVRGWSEEAIQERLEEDAYQPFDLEQGPLLRMVIYQKEDDQIYVLFTMHHIISDFWSLTILVNELLTYYQAEKNGTPLSSEPLALKYSDYVAWEEEMLSGEDGERAWEYWSAQLDNQLPVLNLATDRPRQNAQTYAGGKIAIHLDDQLTAGLKTLSQSASTTLYTTLLSAFQVLLHRYSGQDDVLVASPLAGRDQVGLAELVGYFVNPVGMRADFSDQPDFLALLEQVKEKSLGALTHQNYPVDLLAQRLGLSRDPSRMQFFEAMFIMQKARTSDNQQFNAFALGLEGAEIDLDGIRIESMELNRLPAQFDITWMVSELGEELGVVAHYNKDLFDADTIKQMLAHFKTLLSGIIQNPDTPVGSLPLLAEDQRQKILVDWNQTEKEVDTAIQVHQLFEQQASSTPKAIALQSEGEEYTYQKLNQQANQIAHYLLTMDVAPGDLVGIYLKRSANMLASLLGVLKTGAAYVPLDPAYPHDRIALMLDDAHVKVVLTDNGLPEEIQAGNAKVVQWNTHAETIAKQSKRKPKKNGSSDKSMYVIYTSGSTGKPKGVEVPHRAVVNFLSSMRDQPGLTQDDVLLAVTTLSFDIAVLEIFLPLTVGAKVVLSTREVSADGVQLAETIHQSGVTVMQATPSTWQMLIESGWQGKQDLKILCGGEALSRNLANKLVDKSAVLWNMYGPTETTIWSTCHQVEKANTPISIGKPIANTQIYLLDADLQPVPVGVNGEIYIGGHGVALSYLNRPDLTAEKFIQDPFSNMQHARLYKTGDFARYDKDGTLEYLGRGDQQVKIRGHRIELGEIEAAMLSHPSIQKAVVLAKAGLGNQKYLAAYYIKSDDQETISNEGLRLFLRETLPAFMIPGVYIALDAIPLTPNGKVNRRALPEPSGDRPELYTVYVAPRTPQEQILADLGSEVLGIDQIGVHDNFFDLGGNSLKATRLIFLVNEKFEITLPLLRLFENPTIEGISKAVDSARFATDDDQNLVVGMTKEKLLEEVLLDEMIGANGYVYQPKEKLENI
ncbi:MAG: amino acid adenylation domain-containing protein, partial [Chloroflexota bacterium]